MTDGSASSSLTRHLVRGAVGLGSLIAAIVVAPTLAWWAGIPLVVLSLVALRGCPTCWVVGLVETLSRGRLRRLCVDGRCDLTTAEGAVLR